MELVLFNISNDLDDGTAFADIKQGVADIQDAIQRAGEMGRRKSHGAQERENEVLHLERNNPSTNTGWELTSWKANLLKRS